MLDTSLSGVLEFSPIIMAEQICFIGFTCVQNFPDSYLRLGSESPYFVVKMKLTRLNFAVFQTFEEEKKKHPLKFCCTTCKIFPQFWIWSLRTLTLDFISFGLASSESVDDALDCCNLQVFPSILGGVWKLHPTHWAMEQNPPVCVWDRSIQSRLHLRRPGAKVTGSHYSAEEKHCAHPWSCYSQEKSAHLASFSVFSFFSSILVFFRAK